MSRLPLLLGLVLVAAGCVAPGTLPPAADLPGAGAQWARNVVLFGDGHDHRVASQHSGLTTPNFVELAYDPLSTDHYGGQSAAGYFCGGDATTADGRKLVVVSSFDSDVAFVLVDVTDPMKPEKVGEYVVEGTTHYDVDITSDGRYVVIGSDPSPGTVFGALPGAAPGLHGLRLPTAPAPVAPRIYWRDACTGEEREAGPEQQLPLAPATLLVSIEDPTDPQLVDAAPAPVLGPHSVSTATIGGKRYVASSITNLLHQASYFQFFEIVDTPAGGRLVHQSTLDSSRYGQSVIGDPSGGPFGFFATNGHVEAEIALHPVTNKPVVYVSNWDGGLIILDFSNPAAPTRLSQWHDTGADGGATHSTRSIEGTWDGKHYVIVGQEFVRRPVDRPSGWIYVIDDTDPTNPVEVGRWTLPVDSEPHWDPADEPIETWSTHYFRLVERTLFVTMYHGGVWAVDLSTPENLAQPRSIGAFVPDKSPPDPRRDPVGYYDYTPFVLDVMPNPDYTMAVFDGYSGVYTVRFDPANPMPLVPEWPQTGQPHSDG